MRRQKDLRIAIIGAGAAGLTVAEALKHRGFSDITILEKSGRVGGCTYSATYQCDDGRELAYELGTVQPLQNGQLTRLMKKYGGKREDRIPVRVHSLAEGRDVFRADDLGFRYIVRHLPSLLSDVVKLVRYGFKCRDIAKPSLNFPYVADLGCTVDEWLPTVDLKSDLFKTMFGFVLSYLVAYGDRTRPVPVIYHLKLVYACVCDVRSRGYLFASYMTGGYAQLWAKVARGHNILFGESIQEIVREGGLIKIHSNNRWLEFDKLVVACSPNFIIDKMTPGADEAQVFGSLQDTPAIRGAFLARGLPRALQFIADYFLSGSPGMGLIAWHGQVRDDVHLYSFVFAGDVATSDAEIKSSGEQSVARAFGGTITEWLTIKRLPIYQSYFSLDDVRSGIFGRVEKLQGRLDTYYVGQAISVGSIPTVIKYAEDFVRREWGTRGPARTQSPAK